MSATNFRSIQPHWSDAVIATSDPSSQHSHSGLLDQLWPRWITGHNFPRPNCTVHPTAFKLAVLSAPWSEATGAVNKLHKRLRATSREELAVPDALACRLLLEANDRFAIRTAPPVEVLDRQLGGVIAQINLISDTALELALGSRSRHAWLSRSASVWLRLKVLAALASPITPNFALKLWQILGGSGAPVVPQFATFQAVRPVPLPSDLFIDGQETSIDHAAARA